VAVTVGGTEAPPERALLAHAGIEVCEDGMEIVL